MLPTLPLSSVITYEVIPFEKLQKRDVVIYRHKSGKLYTHRIFKRMSATEWWPRGDNCRFADDDYVTPANLVGRVILASDPEPYFIAAICNEATAVAVDAAPLTPEAKREMGLPDGIRTPYSPNDTHVACASTCGTPIGGIDEA